MKRFRWLPIVLLAACSSKPPPEFAPDPGLVARIDEIRILPRDGWVCPGQSIVTDYEAVLNDGTTIPFARDYDEDHPPALHVVFLRRTSAEAEPQGDGDWSTHSDPLLSAVDGFRLRAELRSRPGLAASATVAPDYSCLPHTFRFVGRTGPRGRSGFSGPDVLVRLDVLASPFYERVLVAGIEVGDAPPFYVMHDADAVPPADWFVVESVGGRGGRGENGEEGVEGVDGQDGCPGSPGGAGGAGSNGGPGGAGGSGGPITVIVPTDEPFLAGLVDARSPGGRGGAGGSGGDGGPGGAGGEGLSRQGRTCADGQRGPSGAEGADGRDGTRGPPGTRPRVITVSPGDVFGTRVPFSLQALIDFSRR